MCISRSLVDEAARLRAHNESVDWHVCQCTNTIFFLLCSFSYVCRLSLSRVHVKSTTTFSKYVSIYKPMRFTG